MFVLSGFLNLCGSEKLSARFLTMDVLFFFAVMSFLKLTAAEFFEGDVDVVEPMVDPTGWDYDRVATRSFRRYACIVDPSGWNYDGLSECTQSENDGGNVACETLLSKCEADVAYLQLRSISAIPADANSQTNFSVNANSSSFAFIKRFINLLLESARLLEDEKSTSGDIEIIITPVELKVLIDYSSSRIDMPLRELDSILSNIIHKKPLITNSFSWKDMIYSAIVQKEIWLYSSIFCIVVTFCRVVLTVRTVNGVAKLTVFALFIASYLIEYFKMYKAVEIRQRAYLQRHPDVPDACNPKKQNLLFNMFEGLFSFKKNECEKYYKELWTEPFMEVSPLCVLSSILADFVLYPAGKFGNAIVLFSSAVLGELPIQYGWFVFLMSSFGIFVTVVLVLIIMCGGSVRLGGLLGGLEVSQNRRLRESERIAIQSESNSNRPEPVASQSAPTTVDAPSLQRKTSNTHLLLEAVGKTDSFVLMDANSLHTILKGSLIQHRNEIEELKGGHGTNAISSEAKPKKEASNASTRSLLASDSSFDLECSLIDFKSEAGGSPDTQPIKSSSLSSDELLPDCDKIEPITSEEEDVFGSPIDDKRKITTVGHP